MPASEHLAHNGTNAKHILNSFRRVLQNYGAKLCKITKLKAGCNSKSWLACLEDGKENNRWLENDTVHEGLITSMMVPNFWSDSI